jgi:hypothetical protein
MAQFRRPLLVVFVAVSSLAMSGCSWLTSFKDGFNSGYAPKPLVLDKPEDSTSLLGRVSADPSYQQCLVGPSGTQSAAEVPDCQRRRNALVSRLMIDSSTLCTEHLKSIYGNEAAVNIATGSVAVLASGMAAVATGAHAAANLSALSAFSSAERSLFNETIYKSLLTTAIGIKIRQMRDEKGHALLSRASQPIDAYGIEQAMAAVLDYHESCSFFRGLEMALAEGTQDPKEIKRAQLENRLHAQANQINAYLIASGTKPFDFWKKDQTKVGEAIQDPVLKAYVDQLNALVQEWQSLSPAAPAKPVEAGK